MREGSIYHEGVQNTMTYNKYNQTVVSIHAGVIWYFEPHGKLNPGLIYL
jgi:hypothetical protein